MNLIVEAAGEEGTGQVPLSRVLMQQLVGREDAASVWCQRVCEAINMKGQSCAWEKVNSTTLALVEDIEGIVIGLSLAAISEQLMLSHPAIKIQDGCVSLRIHDLRKAPRLQSIPFPTPQQDHNASDQSQQPANTSTPVREGAGNAPGPVPVKQECQGKRQRDGSASGAAGLCKTAFQEGAEAGRIRQKTKKQRAEQPQQQPQKAKSNSTRTNQDRAQTEKQAVSGANLKTSAMLQTSAHPTPTRIAADKCVRVPVETVTVGQWEYAPGTVMYFVKDWDELSRIHSTWEGGEDIVCAVCGEEPRADRIVKECDYCLRNYHQECAGESALWCDSTSDLQFFPCPACTAQGKPQPVPRTSSSSDVFLSSQGALGLGKIQEIYKLKEPDGSILRDGTGREDIRLEVACYLQPKELKAQLEASGKGGVVMRRLETVGEALGDLDVARRVFLTDTMRCCGVDDVHAPAQVFPHEAFQNSDGEDVFLCDQVYCSKTHSLKSVDPDTNMSIAMHDDKQAPAVKPEPARAEAAPSTSPKPPQHALAGPATPARPQNSSASAPRVLKQNLSTPVKTEPAAEISTPSSTCPKAVLNKTILSSTMSYEEILQTPAVLRAGPLVICYMVARSPRIHGPEAVAAFKEHQKILLELKRRTARCSLTSIDADAPGPKKDPTLSCLLTRTMRSQALADFDFEDFSDRLSQKSKDTLEQLFKAVHKVVAYCVIYLLSCVPREDPNLLSHDNATRAGQEAVAKKMHLVMMAVGAINAQLIQGRTAKRRVERKEFFKPVKEVDEGGNATGRVTTWQDLALKGETESIWEYLHETAPDATYNPSDVDEDEIAKAFKRVQAKEKEASKALKRVQAKGTEASKAPDAKKLDLRRVPKPFATSTGPSEPVVPEVEGTSSACNDGEASALDERTHSQVSLDSDATESV